MIFYFIIVDTIKRKTNLFSTKLGTFLSGGLSATTAFCLVWPFETLKNHI